MENGKAKRAALYARISTDQQSADSQLVALREFAERRGFAVVGEFVDVISGVKETRPELSRMMDLVRRRRVDAVVVFKFDRLARSLRTLIEALENFDNLGIAFLSVTEAIDTSSSAGRVIFAVIGAFAGFERDIIRERVKAGLAAAKKRGVRLGRPPVKWSQVRTIQELRGQGLSLREIGKQLNLSGTAVFKTLQKNPLQPPQIPSPQ